MANRNDPRIFQIGVLSLLLGYGVLFLDFEVEALRAAATLVSALVTQYCGSRLTRQRFDPRSALISGLSLSLLMRTDQFWLAPAGAALAIASKFVLRIRGKHLFNPTCFALVALMGMSDRVWVSAGQWGSTALFAFAVAGLGFFVTQRAARSDVTWAFLGFYTSAVIGRSIWLGEPLGVPLHGLVSGALLIFAFFMISDPKTIPDARPARVLFAGLVAATALWIQFGLYHPNALLWALAACAPAVPLLDRIFPARRYQWRALQQNPKGENHATLHPSAAGVAAARAE